MMGLTAKQRELYDFIAATIAEKGVAPSFGEMLAATGRTSKNNVHRLLTGLEERGYIRRIPVHARAIELLPAGEAVELRPEVRSAAVRYASQHGIKLSTLYAEAITAYVVGDKAA
jgi:repressor LexA